MKKILFYALAVAALACGCTKELNNETNVPDEGTTTVIKASVDTKTVLEGTKVKWVSGDQISVNGVTSDALSIAEPTASVDFTFGSDLAAEKKAVYPATFWTSDGTITLPATQALGTSASFDTDVEPLCAYVASGNTLSFLHTCAIIKVQLKVGADDDEISYVEFSGNADEQVSGVFNINYSTGVLTGTSSAAADKIVKVTVGQALTSTALPVYIVVPAGTYSDGFKIRVVDENSHVMTRRVGAVTLAAGHLYPLPVDTFDHDGTIKAFVKHYVKILDVWENTTGTIDLLKGEDYVGGEYNVSGAHYVPSTTTIIVGEKTYNTADMFETALRCYLLVRGYNGLDLTHYGKGSISALAGGAVGMSETAVPATHDYYFGTAPYSETGGNGGYLYISGSPKIYHKAKVGLLDNWAMRAMNFQSGRPISNICSYSGGQLSGYGGSFCPMRALVTYAFFFKYMLDNGYDKGTEVADDVQFRSELFGKDGSY